MNNYETRFLRNKDLIPLKSLTSIDVIGLGGIGSFVLQALAIMGWRDISGYDSDDVLCHNLSSTAYTFDDVDMPKKMAANKLHARHSEDWQNFYPAGHFNFEKFIGSRVIICTDSMASRKMAYEAWKRDWEKRGHFFIDLRMGATSMEMVTVTPDNDNYMETWIPDGAIEPEPCSMKHTVFTTQHIASLGIAQVYNIIGNLAYYDYIWASLTPIQHSFGKLIVPKIEGDVNATSTNNREKDIDGLEGNAIGSNVSIHRSA